jgi:hypothetical protein
MSEESLAAVEVERRELEQQQQLARGEREA